MPRRAPADQFAFGFLQPAPAATLQCSECRHALDSVQMRPDCGNRLLCENCHGRLTWLGPSPTPVAKPKKKPKWRCERCGQEWEIHPFLAVPCPRCQAPAGRWCKRPSEHRAAQIHVEREALAVSSGALKKCTGEKAHPPGTLGCSICNKPSKIYTLDPHGHGKLCSRCAAKHR